MNAILKTLKFANAARASNDPKASRRLKIISGLEQQKLLFANPAYIITEQKWEVGQDGVKSLVERQRKVKRWWLDGAGGEVLLTVRYGARSIEFEKGKAAIVVGSKDKLPEVIDAVIAAVQAGELDGHLESAAHRPPRSP